MDWKDVGKVIAPLAPTLGGILGGLIPFPGGALVGTALGNIIARQFGVEPTPQAVSDAIARMPHELALAKLQAATEQARIEVEGFAKSEREYFETLRVAIPETGKSWREELKPENRHWFYTGWRPAAGWILDFYAFVFGAMLSVATFIVIRTAPDPLKALSDAWPIYAAYFGILAALVGVYVVARSSDKAAGKDTSTLAPAPAKPIVKK